MDLYDPLPKDNFSDMTKFKASADEKSTVANIMISVFNRVENIMRKGENVDYQFSMFSFSGLLKVRIMW